MSFGETYVRSVLVFLKWMCVVYSVFCSFILALIIFDQFLHRWGYPWWFALIAIAMMSFVLMIRKGLIVLINRSYENSQRF